MTKKQDMATRKKLNIQLWLSVVIVIFGLVMLSASFVVPPLGVIEASVLAALGELLTFAGSLMGIDYSYKFKRYKTDVERGIILEEEKEEHEDTED